MIYVNNPTSIIGGATEEELTALSEANTRLEDGLGVYNLGPVPTKELVYTLSNTGDYYIVKGLSSNYKGGELNIPSKYNDLPVNMLGVDAFRGNKTITSVYIDEGIKEILNQCFDGCFGIESIKLPSSMTKLNGGCFYVNNNLRIIDFGKNSKLTFIDENVFNGDGVLNNVIIPKMVNSIGRLSFAFCRALTNLSYEGTITQWNAIIKGDMWNKGVPATVVHCIDGDVNI